MPSFVKVLTQPCAALWFSRGSILPSVCARYYLLRQRGNVSVKENAGQHSLEDLLAHLHSTPSDTFNVGKKSAQSINLQASLWVMLKIQAKLIVPSVVLKPPSRAFQS